MQSEHLTNLELTIIRKRADGASPGPWVSYIEDRDHSSGSDFIATGKGSHRIDIEIHGATTADQDFIASSRTNVIKLLDEIDRLLYYLRQ